MSSMMQLTCLSHLFGLFLVLVHMVVHYGSGYGSSLGMVGLELEFRVVEVVDFGTVEAEDFSGGLFNNDINFPSS